MKQNLAEKTDRANNGPVKDRLRRGGLVKKSDKMNVRDYITAAILCFFPST